MSANCTAEETNIRIPGDMFINSMQKLVKSKKLSDWERDQVVWYYHRVQNLHMSLGDVGEELDMSGNDAWRMFFGRLDSYGLAIRQIDALRTSVRDDQNLTFVETTTWAKINQVCMYAAAARKPVFISGVSQIGKTTCLEEFTRRNDTGRVKILTIPPKPSFGAVTYELAKLFHLPPRGYNAEIKSRIFDAIDARTLLIVDEIHQAMQKGVPHQNTIGIMEFLRFIHDKCKCGMVFSGTKLFRSEMDSGPLAPILDQFRRRSIVSLVLPEVTPTEDLNAIAASYSLPPPSTDDAAHAIVTKLVKSSGIGQYIIYLDSAANLARSRKQPISWTYFTAAYDLVQSLTHTKVIGA